MNEENSAQESGRNSQIPNIDTPNFAVNIAQSAQSESKTSRQSREEEKSNPSDQTQIQTT